jgi:hypothetical protein
VRREGRWEERGDLGVWWGRLVRWGMKCRGVVEEAKREGLRGRLSCMFSADTAL